MRRALAWTVQWVACWCLWLLLAGQWNGEQLVAATIAATVAATIGEIARTLAGVRLGRPSFAGVWKVPWAVVSDFAILMWALPTRRGGVFRERPAASVSKAFLANLSPNAYVVEMDSRRVVLHDFVPRRASEEPL